MELVASTCRESLEKVDDLTLHWYGQARSEANDIDEAYKVFFGLLQVARQEDVRRIHGILSGVCRHLARLRANLADQQSNLESGDGTRDRVPRCRISPATTQNLFVTEKLRSVRVPPHPDEIGDLLPHLFKVEQNKGMRMPELKTCRVISPIPIAPHSIAPIREEPDFFSAGRSPTNHAAATLGYLEFKIDHAKLIPIKVTMVESPSSFYVLAKDLESRLEALTKRVNSAVEAGQVQPMVKEVMKEGRLCLCRRKSAPAFWARGEIVRFVDEETATVMLLDHGKKVEAALDDMYKIPHWLTSEPKYSQWCALNDLSPARPGDESEWPEEAVAAFEMILGREAHRINLVVVSRREDGLHQVRLFHINIFVTLWGVSKYSTWGKKSKLKPLANFSSLR